MSNFLVNAFWLMSCASSSMPVAAPCECSLGVGASNVFSFFSSTAILTWTNPNDLSKKKVSRVCGQWEGIMMDYPSWMVKRLQKTNKRNEMTSPHLITSLPRSCHVLQHRLHTSIISTTPDRAGVSASNCRHRRRHLNRPGNVNEICVNTTNNSGVHVEKVAAQPVRNEDDSLTRDLVRGVIDEVNCVLR